MGGKNSVINKGIKDVGKSVGDVVGENNTIYRGVGDVLKSGGKAYGDIWKNVNDIYINKYAGGLVRGLKQGVGEGLGEITGSNALRKQAMDQQQANEEEAKRQSMVSDAMARGQGGDATNIFLATGKRSKGNKGGGTGSAGTGSSRDTGVQS